MAEPKKLNLALQGGGAHGAFTWGVLDRLLEEDDLEFTAISGTSAGAMNAVVTAEGKKHESVFVTTAAPGDIHAALLLLGIKPGPWKGGDGGKLAIPEGASVTVAVCDSGGHLLWLQRMDGAPLMSASVAPEKARTCVLTGKPSKVFEDMVNDGRYAALAMPVVPLEGGEMIVVDGHLVGAVGVSGVKKGEDAQVARAGVAAVGARCGFN